MTTLILSLLAQTATLRGEVVDADTGHRRPARLYVQGEDGRFHTVRSAGGLAVPYEKKRGASVEVHTSLTAQPFEVELPPGRYTLTAERGKEYLPAVLRVSPGETVTLRLKRFTDAAERGWWSGETHVHRPLEDLPALMEAEDLNVAFPLTYWVTSAFDPPKAGKGSVARDPEPALIQPAPDRAIWPRNTEYEIFTVGGKPRTLGAFFVLGHRELLDRGVPPVRPSVETARREGALLELDKHNWPWSMMLVPVLGIDLFELANNHHWRTDFGFPDFAEREAAWMKVERDAKGFTELGWTEFGFRNWYALLNCGYRLRPTAGSASGVHPVPLGFGRVYVKLPGRFSYDAWVRGLDAGRSFVTTGPLLYATADEEAPGAVFRGTRTLRLSGDVESAVPIGRLEIVVNGEVARELRPQSRRREDGSYSTPLYEVLKIESGSWFAVRCFEKRDDGRIRFAHTAPWHVDVPGRPLRPRAEEVEYLARRVEAELERHAGALPEAALDEYREAAKAYRALLPK